MHVVVIKALANDVAKTVVAHASEESVLGTAAGKGQGYVGVGATNNCGERTGLIAVFDQVDKCFTDNKNHGFSLFRFYCLD